MSKKIIKKISLLIIIFVLNISIVGCATNTQKAKGITFTKVSNSELNYTQLENDGNSKICLVNKGVSEYSIYVSNNASSSLKRAVNELKSVIYIMSGANLNVKNELDNNKGIIIGSLANISTTGVKNDGFITNIQEDKIEIKGTDDNGSRNGVYSFIEDYLGVMFFSYNDSYIPKHSSIYLEKTKTINNPKTAWRNVYSIEASKNLWCAKLKLNGYNVEKSDEELGIDINDTENYGKQVERMRQYNEWGTWCHSYYSFLSPEEYFDSHPEYFSLNNGKRIIEKDGRQGQLCLSNPEVYKIVESNLLKKIEQNPYVKYWDFSCNDSPNVPGCKCNECKKLDSQAGGTGMGSLLPFINKLARKVKQVYPNKEIYISTLAYLHTLQPPTNDIKVEDNVVIKLCSMPGDQGTSYLNPNNKNAKDFSNFLASWSKIAKHIVVWDYVVDFANLLMPFPNFAVQQENQLAYENNNIQGIFHQASREVGGEMTMLRTYVLSKLMWQGSSLDVAKTVSKFVSAYYGNASDKVIEYLNLLHENLSKNSYTLGLYDSVGEHAKGYLSKENITRYEKIISNAKNKVKDDKKLLSRVEDIELNIMYAKLNLPSTKGEEKEKTIDRFNKLCNENNITMVREWQSVEDFNNNIDKELSKVKTQVNKPIYITIGVVSGVLILVAILLVIHKCKKRKFKTNSN